MSEKKLKKGKTRMIITVVLILVVAGAAIWGGTSGWFQGSLLNLSKISTQQNKNIQVKDIQKKESSQNSNNQIAVPVKVSFNTNVANGGNDVIIYKFKVNQSGALDKNYKIKISPYDSANFSDLKLWESTYVRAQLGANNSLPAATIFYNAANEYTVTADLQNFTGNTITVSLADENNSTVQGSEVTLDVTQ